LDDVLSLPDEPEELDEPLLGDDVLLLDAPSSLLELELLEELPLPLLDPFLANSWNPFEVRAQKNPAASYCFSLAMSHFWPALKFWPLAGPAKTASAMAAMTAVLMSRGSIPPPPGRVRRGAHPCAPQTYIAPFPGAQTKSESAALSDGALGDRRRRPTQDRARWRDQLVNFT
jgi:hypothetical protein